MTTISVTREQQVSAVVNELGAGCDSCVDVSSEPQELTGGAVCGAKVKGV